MLGKQYADMEEGSSLLPKYNPIAKRPRKPWSHRRCYLTLFAALVLAGFLFSLAICNISPPTSTSSPDLPPPSAPGIGISLSHHSVTIAVRSSDGTTTNVAHIPAPSAYTSLLKRLSQPSARHPSPPYSSLSESYRDRPRQWRRVIRKRLGWPASADVGILAEVLQECADVVKSQLGGIEVKAAVAVVPNAMALYAEDVQDALEHIGWKALSGHNVYGVPRALPAAYAGYGFGLCDTPEDFEACVKEEKSMSRRNVMTVDSGNGVIATDARGMDTPMYVFNDKYATLDWDAGDNKERIALNVRTAVESLKTRSIGVGPGERYVDEVLMIGEDEGRWVEPLEDIVRNEVARVQSQEARIWDDDPSWVVARGAAELAKRILVQRGRVI